MSSRHAVAVFDAELARQQTQAELRSQAAPKKIHEVNKIGGNPHELSAEAKAKMAAALQMELEHARRRADERRRRDPTYRPDAIDLDRSKVKRFNKFVDYYEVLGLTRDDDKFCSAAELKAAYKKRSFELHPDKQHGKSPEEQVAAAERFHQIKMAYEILSEPATRQLYDRARDKLEAEYEAGVVVNDDEQTKPPPSCVDVRVSLEELFEGGNKYVRYTRMMFEGTKWEKKTDDTFTLFIRPGELEGATFWFRNQGDVTTLGKADLVFVLVQEPHPVYERIGSDLWYRYTEPMDARQLTFCGVVPTMEGIAKKWVNNKLTSVGVSGSAVAVGQCLSAALGFDRSGWGEAIVKGKGMPLLAEGEDARRGKGELDERDQKPGAQPAPKPKGVGGAQLPRGDLVVKYRVTFPADAPLRRASVWLPPGTLLMPPVALLTSEQSLLPHGPLCSLLLHTVLPAVLERRFFALLASPPAADATPPAPPTLAPPPPPPPPPPAPLLTVAQIVDIQDEYFASDIPIDEDKMCHWSEAAVREYFQSGGEAIPPPAPPRRTAPPLPIAGPLKGPPLLGSVVCVGGEAGVASAPDGGVELSAAARQLMGAVSAMLPQLRWRVIHMADGVEQPLLPDEEEAVEASAVVVLELVRDDAGRPGQLVLDPKTAKLVPVTPKSAFFVRKDVRVPLEEEALEEEMAVEEADVSRRRAESQYADGGAALGRKVWCHPTAEAIYNAHCRGSVILAIDQACALLGRPLLAGDLPTPRQSLLPFAVGLGAPNADVPHGKLSWRRLCSVSLRSQVSDCRLGFASLGLPPGFVGSALACRGWAVRAALGSASARKLPQAEMSARHTRVKEAQLQRKAERERARNLAELERTYVEHRVQWPPHVRSGGPWADMKGDLRGHCLRCNECPGFDTPDVAGLAVGSTVDVCVHCGCGAPHHEKLRSEKDRQAEAKDDVLVSAKAPSQ